MNSDQYKTIKSYSKGSFKDKGSKFFAFAFPIKKEEQIQEYRDKIKKEYHDARHHVFAYRLGPGMEIIRSSDDGEPANSSGPPVLGKIRSYELTDILIIVVRYFGGTKLGIPGLINAYGTAAEDSIKNADIIVKTIYRRLTIEYEYPEMNNVMRIIKENSIKISEQDFQLSCKIVLDIADSQIEKMYNLFKINHKLNVRKD